MKKLLLFLLLILACPAFAQNQTTVTGTLTDPNGIAYYPATVLACLSPSTLNPKVGGNSINLNQGSNYCIGPVSTSPSGFFQMALYTNASITPAATSWIFTVQAAGTPPPVGNGTLNFSSAGVTISGTSQDVSTNINSVGAAQFRTSSSSFYKPTVADGARFISATGNDANDGLSMGSAKATLSGAYSSLANCTNIAFVGGSGAVTNPCGTIYFLESVSGYTIGSTVSIAGFGVRLVGLGMHPTVLNCTVAGSCIQWTAVGPAGGVAFTADYGLSNITLNGTNASNQIGLACIDCNGITLDHVRFANFAGTNGIGTRLLNDANFYSERTEFFDVWWDNCTIGLQISGQGGTNQNSYGHQLWSGLHFTLANNNQTAFSAIGNAQLYSSSIYGVINTNLPGTNTYTSVAISGTATIKGNFGLILDNGGAATVTTSGTTAANFDVWGFDPASNDQSLVSRDLPVVFDVTASSAINSPTWRINGVAKWNQFLDGSNSLCTFDAVNSKSTACFLPNVGALQLLAGGVPTGFASLGTIYMNSTTLRLGMSNNSNNQVTIGTTPAYSSAGVEQFGTPHIVQDTATLAAGTVTVTFTSNAVFTNATSYTCVADDDTAIGATRVLQNSGSSVTITGTGTDVIRYICVGN